MSEPDDDFIGPPGPLPHWDESGPPGFDMYFDRQGKPVTMRTWVRLYEEDNQVRLTKVGPYAISTVWMGLNSNFRPDGPPLIFETMVFADGEGFREYDSQRYSTEAEATAGHEELITLILAILPESAEAEELHV